MIRTPPRSTRNDTLSPYTTPCRSHQRGRLLRLLLGPPRAAPRARPLLPPRRRQLRALRPRGDAAVPLHQALAAPHRARPGKQPATRPRRTAVSRQALSRPRRARAGREAPLLDHVDRRITRQVFRDRGGEGPFCRLRSTIDKKRG